MVAIESVPVDYWLFRYYTGDIETEHPAKDRNFLTVGQPPRLS